MLRNLWFIFTLLLACVFVLQHAVVVVPQHQLGCVYQTQDKQKACTRILPSNGSLQTIWPFFESVQWLPAHPALDTVSVKLPLAGKVYESQWVIEWQLIDHHKPQGALPKPLLTMLADTATQVGGQSSAAYTAPMAYLNDALPRIQQALVPLYAKEGVALKRIFVVSVRLPAAQQTAMQQITHRQMQDTLTQQAKQQQDLLLKAQQTAEQAGQTLLTEAYQEAQKIRSQAQVQALQDYQAAFGAQTGLLEALWDAQNHPTPKQEK